MTSYVYLTNYVWDLNYDISIPLCNSYFEMF